MLPKRPRVVSSASNSTQYSSNSDLTFWNISIVLQLYYVCRMGLCRMYVAGIDNEKRKLSRESDMQ